MEQEQRTKFAWADNLRFLAVIGVILVHVAMEARIADLYYDVFIAGWARVCVPLFIMLSGMFVLAKEIELIKFLRKAVGRIILPFIFWSLIYSIIQFTIVEKGHFKPIWIVASILTRNTFTFHFWYVYMIVGIYLFIPILSRWILKAPLIEIKYFLILWIVTLFGISALKLTYFSGYLGYLVLGFYLGKIDCVLKPWKAFLIFLAGFLITTIGTIYFSTKNRAFDERFYNYLSLNVLIMAVGIFLLFKNLNLGNNQVFAYIRNIVTKYSYGIYLVHILVLHFLKSAGINWYLVNPLFGILITSFLCLVISTSIVALINRIPYLGKYVSG